jgi:serine/threonine protein kinase
LPNLTVERGREKGTTFELKPETPCVAGRDPASVQIVISDPAASRRHFQVAAKDGRWFVTDLSSKNHTYLNAEKLEKPVELANGDRIQVGETVLSFIAEDLSDKATAQGLNGKEIGGYKILERLGRGGMGTVFKAKQISLNRVVALKVLASKFAKDPKFVEKFVSEARAAGQLNHPNVVQVFDVGQLGGLHFFSMELMEGGCVQDMLSAAPEGRLTWQEAMPLIVDASRGLVFAEKRGIIHRDIKPDNLMLTSEQRVKIGDLGLAKKAEEGSGDKSIFGTPHFIAPEQAQGKELTHAADLYALGATFYRMVTGRTPFAGDTVKEILKKQINEPHQPIPQVVPEFPEDLAAIVDKLMAKKVESRYQSATKLVEDLEAFQLEHQIELSGARKLNKPLMIGAILVALGAASVGIYYATRPPEKGDTMIVKEEDLESKRAAKEAAERAEAAQVQLQERDAQKELLQIQVEDAKLGAVALEKEADFLKVADRYDALKTTYSHERLSATIQPGIDRAKEIRESLQKVKDDIAARETAARTWWDGVKKSLEDAETAKQWSDEIRIAEKWLKDPELAKHGEIVKEAKTELAKVEARAVELAATDAEKTREDAQKAIANGGGIEKAIADVTAWADALERSRPANEKLKGFVQDARQWVDDRRNDLQLQLTQQLDADLLTYVAAIRGLRQGGSGSGVIFDLQFGAAAEQLQTAAAALKSYPYKRRAAAHVQRLRSAERAWSAWIQLFAEGKIFHAGEDLKGLPGASPGVTYKVNLDEPTTERYTVDTVVSGGRTKKVLAWSDLEREQLASIFLLPRAEKVPGDVALGLAWMFVEMGDPVAAQSLLDRAAGSGHKIAAEEETALRREINALNSYEDLRRKQGDDPNTIVQAVTAWRETFAGCDTYVLLDGREGKELKVLSNDEVNLFLANHGREPDEKR